MAETTTVHVMRHGEVHNPERILYGRLEGYGLSDRGRVQAEAAARALKDNDIVIVVASPLRRAQETAVPIATSHSLDIVTDPDLIESLNYFEGRRVSPGDGAWRDPRVWWQLRNPFKPSWGEPYKEIAARMTIAMDNVRVKAAGHEAVCVSHQLPVEVLRRHLEGKWLPHDPRRRQTNLGSVTSFVYDGDQLVDIRYDEPAGS